MRLEEGEILARDACGRGIFDVFQGCLIQRGEKRVEDFQSMGIVRTARGACKGLLGSQISCFV